MWYSRNRIRGWLLSERHRQVNDDALYHPDVWDDTRFFEKRWDRDVKREVPHCELF